MLSTSAQLLFWTEIFLVGASLVVQMVMNLSGMLETRVRSLSGEDSLEKEMATLSSIFTWEILWTEEPGGVTKQSDTT